MGHSERQMINKHYEEINLKILLNRDKKKILFFFLRGNLETLNLLSM
jgi:hypothetical protein